MDIVIIIFLFVSLMLLLLGISGFSSSSAIRTRLPVVESRVSKRRRPLEHIFPFVPAILDKLKLGEKIKNLLEAAHLKLSPAEFFSVKLLIISFLGLVSFFLLGRFEPAIVLLAAFLGYFIPDFWLKKKITQRKFAIRRFLPETVDLLGLCVEAGLDFTSALRWIIEKKIYSNPMIEELAVVLEEIKWGKPRSQALRDMGKRVGVSEVSSFVHLLIQAERMGTPVSETFGIISEDTRLQRFREGERFALKAPIKILIPLIFCILPVIGIIVAGPVLLTFMKGNIFK
jgi:tight adherence protein C